MNQVDPVGRRRAKLRRGQRLALERIGVRINSMVAGTTNLQSVSTSGGPVAALEAPFGARAPDGIRLAIHQPDPAFRVLGKSLLDQGLLRDRSAHDRSARGPARRPVAANDFRRPRTGFAGNDGSR